MYYIIYSIFDYILRVYTRYTIYGHQDVPQALNRSPGPRTRRYEALDPLGRVHVHDACHAGARPTTMMIEILHHPVYTLYVCIYIDVLYILYILYTITTTIIPTALTFKVIQDSESRQGLLYKEYFSFTGVWGSCWADFRQLICMTYC